MLLAFLEYPSEEMGDIFKMIVECLPGDSAFFDNIFYSQLFDIFIHQKSHGGFCNLFFCIDRHVFFSFRENYTSAGEEFQPFPFIGKPEEDNLTLDLESSKISRVNGGYRR